MPAYLLLPALFLCWPFVLVEAAFEDWKTIMEANRHV